MTPLIGTRVFAVVAWAGIILNIVILPIVLVMLSIVKEESKDAGSRSTGTMAIVGSATRHALMQPVVIAPVLPIALVLLGIKVPADAISALKLLGSTDGGESLFASGVILQAQGS